LGLFVATTAFGADNVAITVKAREHFKAGVAYIDDPSGPKYEEAYREFKRAYTESPTYKILTNLGLCALNLERDGEAIEAYEGFLAKAKPEDIPKDKRELMERDVSTLKASLVRITVEHEPATLVLSDERIPSKGSSIINRYDSKSGKTMLGIHPGHHRITALAEGFEPQTWDFEADSASTHTHVFKLKPVGSMDAAATSSADAPKSDAHTNQTVTAPTETKRSIPTLVYVGAAATGVFAISATVTGILASKKHDDFDRANNGGNPEKAQDLRDKGKTYSLLTDIGIGAAVLSAAGTAILYFTAPKSTVETRTGRRRLLVEPTIAPNHAGLAVSGQF
jgi:hypothetical protein